MTKSASEVGAPVPKKKPVTSTVTKKKEDHRDRSNDAKTTPVGAGNNLGPGDASMSNYSAVKLGLGGLRNDDMTESSLITETDLNTLNTGKVMAAMIDKGDIADNSYRYMTGTAGKAVGLDDVIDERDEDEAGVNKSVRHK